jgi:hypothetical protein
MHSIARITKDCCASGRTPTQGRQQPQPSSRAARPTLTATTSTAMANRGRREHSWHGGGTSSTSFLCGGGNIVERTRFRRTRGLAEQEDEDGCGATITTASSGSFATRSLAEPMRPPPQQQQQQQQQAGHSLPSCHEAFDRDVGGGGPEVAASAPLIAWHVHGYYDETQTLLFQVQQLPCRGPLSSFAPSQVILSCEEVGSYVRQLLRAGGGGAGDEPSSSTRLSSGCSVQVTADSNCWYHPLVQCLMSWTGEAAATGNCGGTPTARTTHTLDDSSTRDMASSVALSSSSSSSSQGSDGGKTRSTRDACSNVTAVGRWRRWLGPRWSLSTPALLLSAAGSSRRPSLAPAPLSSLQHQGQITKSRRTTSSDTQAATADETVLLLDRVPSFVDHPPTALVHDDILARDRASAILMANELEDYPKDMICSVAQPSHRTAPSTFAANNERSAFHPPAAAGRSQVLAANGGGFQGVQNQDQGVWI